MGTLNASLIDRARIVRATAAAARVEGATPLADVIGDDFPCRLIPTDAGERDGQGGVRSVLARAHLVCPAGIDVRPTDRVEVRSRWQGEATWRVIGEPEQATTRRAVRAVVIPLERVTESNRESVLT